MSSRFLRRTLVTVVPLVLLASAGPASAHDSTTGSTVVTIDDDRVVVGAAVDFEELGFTDTSGDGLIDAEELTVQRDGVAATLVSTVRDHVTLFVDGEPLEIVGAGVPAPSEFERNEDGASPYVGLVLASDTHDGEVTDVALSWTFEGASATVVVSDAEGAVAGDLTDDGELSVSLDAGSTAASFFGLGIEHIQFGPDHLLFLLVLTLTVAGTTVSRETTGRTVKLVTAFTLGHALSLGAAYVHLVSIPAWVVEPAISLSIVAAAVLAIRGRASKSRPWIAAIIGLVHGLGFASSLDSLGVATSQQAVALTAFNLGIDVAQTAVVLGVIGVLWLSARILDERIVWLRTSLASASALVGMAWTVTRLADVPF